MTIDPVPQGAVPAIGIPNSEDIPRLVYCAPYFTTVPLAELIEPSVTEAVEAMLPSLVPPYVDQAANAAVQQLAVLLAGSTMQGPLFLNPVMPTQPSQAASMAYVDAMIATAGIPEVPPTPVGQVWARMTGQWTPIAEEGGTFLPIGGGTMQGQINMGGNAITNLPALPVMPNGAAPAQWVLNQISSVSLYQGTWNMDTYTPDLTQLSTHVNGWTWIAITTSVSGVVIGPPIPGLQGQTVFNGDTVIFSAAAGAFQFIHGGGLSLAEANALYVQLAGSQMSGPLLLNANATAPTQATTLQQVQTLVAGFISPEAPTDGQAYLRIGATRGWTPGLPLTGGITTGPILLSGNAANALQAVPYQQLTSYTAGLYVPLAGATMVGPLVLSGNAAANLNPVPLGQLNTMLGSYLPLGGGTLTGTLNSSVVGNTATSISVLATEIINRSGAALPTAPGGGTTTLWLANPSGNGLAQLLDAWGAGSGGPQIFFRSAGGTPTAPTAHVNTDFLGGLSWIGYNGSAYGGSSAVIFAQAIENWSTAANGSQLVFWLTPAGTVSNTQILGLNYGGSILNSPLNIYRGTTVAGAAFGGCLEVPIDNWIWTSPGGNPLQLLAFSSASGYLLLAPTITTQMNVGQFTGVAAANIGGLGFGYLEVPLNQWLYVNNGGSFIGLMEFNASVGFLVIGQSITTQTSDFVCAGTPFANQANFTLLSDPQVKTNQQDYTKGVSLIAQLDPITYSYNGLGMTPDDMASDPPMVRYGFDAAALQVIMPELVTSRSVKLHPTDTTTTSLLTIGDQMPLVMTLVNAVKQLIARVQALETAAAITPPLADTA